MKHFFLWFLSQDVVIFPVFVTLLIISFISGAILFARGVRQ